MASIFFLSASLYSFQRFTQASVLGPAIPATAAMPGSALWDVSPDSMKARNFSFTVTSPRRAFLTHPSPVFLFLVIGRTGVDNDLRGDGGFGRDGRE